MKSVIGMKKKLRWLSHSSPDLYSNPHSHTHSLAYHCSFFVFYCVCKQLFKLLKSQISELLCSTQISNPCSLATNYSPWLFTSQPISQRHCKDFKASNSPMQRTCLYYHFCINRTKHFYSRPESLEKFNIVNGMCGLVSFEQIPLSAPSLPFQVAQKTRRS